MKPLTQHSGLVAVLDRANVDTDQMVPKQFLKRIERTGFGQVLFFDWRYLGDGSANPDFELNQPRYQGASILVAGKNFGCGSSREHAPWALADYGFRVIIAPSFADIFWGNCFQNGLLPLALPEAAVREIMELAKAQVGYQLTVDLAAQTVTNGQVRFSFNIDPFRRHCLLNGLDDIGLTLQQAAAIATYEEQLPAWRRVTA